LSEPTTIPVLVQSASRDPVEALNSLLRNGGLAVQCHWIAKVADIGEAITRQLPDLLLSVAPSSTELAELAAIRDRLLPIAALVTPNLSEAEALTGRTVQTVAAMRDAAAALRDRGARAVLVKGGHLPQRACDVLVTADDVYELEAPRLDVGPVHGTGCTLSAAITAELAAGHALVDAVRSARAYVRGALAASRQLGRGSRLLDHGGGR